MMWRVWFEDEDEYGNITSRCLEFSGMYDVFPGDDDACVSIQPDGPFPGSADEDRLFEVRLPSAVTQIVCCEEGKDEVTTYRKSS